MALSDILRAAAGGLGAGASSLGRAVQAGAAGLNKALQPAPPQEIEPTPSNTVTTGAAPTTGAPAATSGGFTLPDLGPPPDRKDPKYQGTDGEQRFADDAMEYQHKQDIHSAFQSLDQTFQNTFPNRNFQQEYKEAVAAQQQHQAERPQGSNLARMALALGDFNPALREEGKSNLAAYNEKIGQAQTQSDIGFAQRMALRQKMHEGQAQEAIAKGDYKRALAEQEKSALLSSDLASIQNRQLLERINAMEQGRIQTATIRADAMEQSARIRANAIGAAHGLSGTFLDQFQKEAAKAVGKMLGPRDMTKEYSPQDLDTITNYVEQLGEMFHDQQYGHGSSDTYLQTHPGKRPQPTPAPTKEKF